MRSLLGESFPAGGAGSLALCIALGIVGCAGPSEGEFVGPPEPSSESARLLDPVQGTEDPPVRDTEAPGEGRQGEPDQEPAGQADPRDSEGEPDVDRPDEDPDFVGPRESDSTLDSVQSAVADRVRKTAVWLDSFLGDERALAEQNQTTVTLRLDTFVEEREGVDFNLRFNARVVLPQTEKRFHLVLAGYDDEERSLDDDRQPAGAPENEDRDVGLQYFLKATEQNNIRGQLGMRFDGIQPNPYVGVRWRHTAPLGSSWDLRAFQRLRWYLEERGESITTLDFEHLFRDGIFFRATTTGTWYEQQEGYYFGQYFTVFHWIEDHGLFSYEWNNYFRSRPVYELVETQVRFRFSRRVLKEWILFEIAPQISWREEIDNQPAFGLLFRFEFLFGGPTIQYHSPMHKPLDDPDYDERYDDEMGR